MSCEEVVGLSSYQVGVRCGEKVIFWVRFYVYENNLLIPIYLRSGERSAGTKCPGERSAGTKCPGKRSAGTKCPR